MSDLYSLGLGSGSRLVALLGPTNTGKTHRAIQRMIALKGGMIGLPLRLLAREVYSRLCEATSEQSVALITGEERIIPLNPVFWVCTVESMPLQRLVPIVGLTRYSWPLIQPEVMFLRSASQRQRY